MLITCVYQEYITPKKSADKTLDSTNIGRTQDGSISKVPRQKMLVVSAIKRKLFVDQNNETRKDILDDVEDSSNEVLSINIEHQSYLQRFCNYICPAAVDYSGLYAMRMSYYDTEETEKFCREEYRNIRNTNFPNPLICKDGFNLVNENSLNNGFKSPIEKVSFIMEEGVE